MVQNGDIILKSVFVPDEDKLPGVKSFQDTSKVREALCISSVDDLHCVHHFSCLKKLANARTI